MNDIACANQLMTDEINDVVYLISGGEQTATAIQH